MKTTLLALFLLTASAAFGQAIGASVINSEPNIFHIPSHELRATQSQLANEQSILFTAVNPSAQGERPLWEVVKPAPQPSLGEVARALRQEHATAKKAVKVYEQ
ncbi:MAG TPA: hypothetical protein VLT90_12540 [Terriglobales bacterium]|nr:hypothetical protein [Terriglobales bacterium]